MEIRQEDLDELTTEQLLYILGCRVVDSPNIIIEVMPSIAVEIKRENLRQWCINRITSRENHKNKCVTSGGPSISRVGRLMRLS